MVLTVLWTYFAAEIIGLKTASKPDFLIPTSAK
jgi:hypothetical protein